MIKIQTIKLHVEYIDRSEIKFPKFYTILFKRINYLQQRIIVLN